MSSLFDFHDPNMLLRKATKASTQRRSGTVADTVKHGIVHTSVPESTLHHYVIAACPHPTKAKANEGEYYMVAYVSIPITWLENLSMEFARLWDVSFIGPAGAIQRLPPMLLDMEELLGPRVYVGFDWFWMLGATPAVQQPHHEKIKPKLIGFVSALRERFEPEWVSLTKE